MSRIITGGILGGLIEWKRTYERTEMGGPYDKLVKKSTRYIWLFTKIKVWHTESQEDKQA